MFDVGFSEMLVIGIVALLVIGPEKLPSVARTVGALLGRMQRYVNDVKADINREIELDEFKKLQTTVQDAARSIETSVSDTMSTFQTQADELNKIAAGDIAGLTETKPADTQSADAAPSGTGLAATAAIIPDSISTSSATTAVTGEAIAGTPEAVAAPAADTHAEAMAMLAAAEAAPGPAAIAGSAMASAEVSAAANTGEAAAQTGSQSGSQGTLPLEPAPTNVPVTMAAVKPAAVSA